MRLCIWSNTSNGSFISYCSSFSDGACGSKYVYMCSLTIVRYLYYSFLLLWKHPVFDYIILLAKRVFCTVVHLKLSLTQRVCVWKSQLKQCKVSVLWKCAITVVLMASHLQHIIVIQHQQPVKLMQVFISCAYIYISEHLHKFRPQVLNKATGHSRIFTCYCNTVS